MQRIYKYNYDDFFLSKNTNVALYDVHAHSWVSTVEQLCQSKQILMLVSNLFLLDSLIQIFKSNCKENSVLSWTR